MSIEVDTLTPVEDTPVEEKTGFTALRVITWFSVGMAVAALGIFVGAEIRSRYRFKKRTPYDFYSKRRRAAGGRIRRRHLTPAEDICCTRCRLRRHRCVWTLRGLEKAWPRPHIRWPMARNTGPLAESSRVSFREERTEDYMLRWKPNLSQ